YFVHYGGETRGPYLIDQIRSMWASGIITADAVYWNEEHSAWELVVELVKSGDLREDSKQTQPKPPTGAIQKPQPAAGQAAKAGPPPLPKPHPNTRPVGSRVIGIDLGTSSSLVAVMEGAGPRLIADRQGRTVLPSIIV